MSRDNRRAFFRLTDFTFAARRLRATPLFTIFAVLSLGLGVSVTTAVYSIVNTIFLKQSGIHDPDRVAFVVTPYDNRLLKGSVSEPDVMYLRSGLTSFSALSAVAPFSAAVTSSSTTELFRGEGIDGAYFATLGVRTTIGRAIDGADDDASARVVVLSQVFWRARFGADPRIVGNTIRISGHAFEIIGVAAGPFEGATGLVPVHSSGSPSRQKRRLRLGPLQAPIVAVCWFSDGSRRRPPSHQRRWRLPPSVTGWTWSSRHARPTTARPPATAAGRRDPRRNSPNRTKFSIASGSPLSRSSHWYWQLPVRTWRTWCWPGARRGSRRLPSGTLWGRHAGASYRSNAPKACSSRVVARSPRGECSSYFVCCSSLNSTSHCPWANAGLWRSNRRSTGRRWRWPPHRY